MFAIYYDRKGARGYVYKHDGMNSFVSSIWDATHFATREEAHDARPGHHRDMGGDGFFGRVVPVPKHRTDD